MAAMVQGVNESYQGAIGGGATPELGLRWIRSCPACNRLVIRSWPWVVVRCGCGWQWNN